MQTVKVENSTRTQCHSRFDGRDIVVDQIPDLGRDECQAGIERHPPRRVARCTYNVWESFFKWPKFLRPISIYLDRQKKIGPDLFYQINDGSYLLIAFLYVEHEYAQA